MDAKEADVQRLLGTFSSTPRFYVHARIQRLITATGNQMHNRNEDERAQRCRRQRINKSAAQYSKPHKYPSAEKGTDQPQHNVGDTAISFAARNLSRQPPGDQANHDPAKQAALIFHYHYARFKKCSQHCRHHGASAKPVSVAAIMAASLSKSGPAL